eukprot:568194-Heterocapsa_arctica.AAC.1
MGIGVQGYRVIGLLSPLDASQNGDHLQQNGVHGSLNFVNGSFNGVNGACPLRGLCGGQAQWALQASLLSPLDSTQNANDFAQHLSLRGNLEPQHNVLLDAYLFVQNTLVMHTCACSPVGPP